jgi:hypothetical protein
MWDLLYVAITLVFFAGMLWYLLGCHSLGGDDGTAGNPENHPKDRRPGGSRDER